MNRLLLFFAFGLASQLAISQSITAVDWQAAVTVPEDEVQYEVAFDVVNTGTMEMDVRVKSEVVSILGTADYRFCWGPTCYNWTQEDFTSPESDALMVTMAPGDTSNTFYTDYRHDMNWGSSVINYCWFDNANPSDEACYEITWTLGAVGIEDIGVQAEMSAVSPNPVAATSSVAYNVSGQSGKMVFTVYNLLGDVVLEQQLNNPMGILFISAGDYDSGVYLISLTVDGKVYSTQKMIVTK